MSRNPPTRTPSKATKTSATSSGSRSGATTPTPNSVRKAVGSSKDVPPPVPAQPALSIREAITLKRAEAKKTRSPVHSSALKEDDTANPSTSSSSQEEDILRRLSTLDTIHRARTTGSLNLAGRALLCLPPALFQVHLGVTPARVSGVPDEPELASTGEEGTKKGGARDKWFETQDLTVLKAWNNDISEVQSEISLFGSLKIVDLHKNILSTLPSSFADLTNLTYLDLSHNRLTTLPDNLYTLPELVTLNLSHNLLTALPFGAAFGLARANGSAIAKRTHVSRNSTTDFFAPLIKRADRPLPRLSTLDASHNKINAGSIDVGCLPKALAKVDMSFCPLSESDPSGEGGRAKAGVQALFDALAKLDRLTELKMECALLDDGCFPPPAPPASLVDQSAPSRRFSALGLLDLSSTAITRPAIEGYLGTFGRVVEFEWTTTTSGGVGGKGALNVRVGKRVIKEDWEVEVERRGKTREVSSASSLDWDTPVVGPGPGGEITDGPGDTPTSSGSLAAQSTSASSSSTAGVSAQPVMKKETEKKKVVREVVKEQWEIDLERGLGTAGGRRAARAREAREREAREASVPVSASAGGVGASCAANSGGSRTSGDVQCGRGGGKEKVVEKEQWEIDLERGLGTEGGRRARAAREANASGSRTGSGSTTAMLDPNPNPNVTQDDKDNAQEDVKDKMKTKKTRTLMLYYDPSTQTMSLPPSAAAPSVGRIKFGCGASSSSAFGFGAGGGGHGHSRAMSLASPSSSFSNGTASGNSNANTNGEDSSVPSPTLPLCAILSCLSLSLSLSHGGGGAVEANKLRVLVLKGRKLDRVFDVPGEWSGVRISGQGSGEGGGGGGGLWGVGYLPNMEELDLSGCNLGDEVGVGVGSSSSSSSSLTPSTTLASNGTTSNGSGSGTKRADTKTQTQTQTQTMPLLSTIARLFPSLQVLDLSFNALTERVFVCDGCALDDLFVSGLGKDGEDGGLRDEGSGEGGRAEAEAENGEIGDTQARPQTLHPVKITRRGLKRLNLQSNRIASLDVWGALGGVVRDSAYAGGGGSSSGPPSASGAGTGALALTARTVNTDTLRARWTLEELDVRNNEVGRLPAEMGYLPLEVFLVDGNVFRVPQRRVWEREGTKGLLGWLRGRIE